MFQKSFLNGERKRSDKPNANFHIKCLVCTAIAIGMPPPLPLLLLLDVPSNQSKLLPECRCEEKERGEL